MFNFPSDTLSEENRELRQTNKDLMSLVAVLVLRLGNRVSVNHDELDNMAHSGKTLRTYIDENTFSRIFEVK